MDMTLDGPKEIRVPHQPNKPIIQPTWPKEIRVPHQPNKPTVQRTCSSRRPQKATSPSLWPAGAAGRPGCQTGATLLPLAGMLRKTWPAESHLSVLVAGRRCWSARLPNGRHPPSCYWADVTQLLVAHRVVCCSFAIAKSLLLKRRIRSKPQPKRTKNEEGWWTQGKQPHLGDWSNQPDSAACSLFLSLHGCSTMLDLSPEHPMPRPATPHATS
jgi:hypothetical protein